MPSTDCRALLFDLDGVLVNSEQCVARTWRRWADGHGLDPEAILTLAHGRRTIDTLRLVAPHLRPEHEAAVLAEIEAHETDGVHEVPGARALLAALPPTRWAIITAGVRAVATLRLRHTRLPEPRVLVAAEELRNGKPDPEGYLKAANRLQVSPSDCIVVEDAPVGIDAARAAGMRSVALTTTHAAKQLAAATWGLRSLLELRVTALRDGLRLDFDDPLWPPSNVAA